MIALSLMRGGSELVANRQSPPLRRDLRRRPGLCSVISMAAPYPDVLGDAFERARNMDASLNERLEYFADTVRAFNSSFADGVDRLVSGLKEQSLVHRRSNPCPIDCSRCKLAPLTCNRSCRRRADGPARLPTSEKLLTSHA